jgi:hypothetical protein
VEPLQNIVQFIGITNVHKSSMWDNTISIVPESLKSKVCVKFDLKYGRENMTLNILIIKRSLT